MEWNQKKGRRLQIVSFVIIAFLTGEVVLLMVQTLSGDEKAITYDDSTKKYLFFVLSTDCPHCINNLTHWKEITIGNDNDNCYILGISMSNLEETNKYAAERDVSFYLSTADTSFGREYKIA
ncbi:MAG: hypothetical protein QME52_10960, partial [Bacteroidota bacterium]|nr:hypothetical protein [Bacteroidota bacterium]